MGGGLRGARGSEWERGGAKGCKRVCEGDFTVKSDIYIFGNLFAGPNRISEKSK